MADAKTTFGKIYDISAILASFDDEKALGSHIAPCMDGSPTENGAFVCIKNADGNLNFRIAETCDAPNKCPALAKKDFIAIVANGSESYYDF
eukprot:62182_1